jgi:arylsulfatase A-like enzyme
MKALVIMVRGLHLGYLGCYGNAWIDTPTLDRLAANGVVFDQHYADCPDAAGARRAWRSGLLDLPLPGVNVTCSPGGLDLVALLRAGHVRTIRVVDGSHGASTDFSPGWDHVRHVQPGAAEGTQLDRTLEAARAALDQLDSRDQWLLWVDLATLLPPWIVPEEYTDPYFESAVAEMDEDDPEDLKTAPLEPLPDPTTGFLQKPAETMFPRLQRTFAGAASYLDAGIGLLLESLEGRELADELLLIITTDHGQALGEHGIVGPYRPWLHDELIHLPLLLRLPHGEEAGRRVAALTQPVDLFATLLELFGLPSQPSHGHSLLPLIRGTTDQFRAYACSGLRLGDRAEWALRTHDWSFILPVAAPPDDPPRLPQLYVKPDDRWEVNNVIQHHLELAEHLEQTLRGFVAATRQPLPLRPPELRDPQAPARDGPDSNPGEYPS